MTPKAETWSSYYVDSHGKRIASARIVLVKASGPTRPSLYNVMVAIADQASGEVSWLGPETVAGSLRDAELLAGQAVDNRASTLSCDGWRLD